MKKFSDMEKYSDLESADYVPGIDASETDKSKQNKTMLLRDLKSWILNQFVEKEDERQTSEQERLAAESIRETNENERITNENNRKDSETQRVAAETEREEWYESLGLTVVDGKLCCVYYES